MSKYIADYCPACGTKTEQKMHDNRLRPICPNCGRVIYFDPKVAAITFIVQDDRALLVKRGIDPGKGLWALPGGFVEVDEGPEDTARRETLEETGLEVKIERLLDIFHHKPDGGVITIAYAATIIGGQLTSGDDADVVQWFRKDEIPEELVFISTFALTERWLNGQI